jgi:hypothetical protein
MHLALRASLVPAGLLFAALAGSGIYLYSGGGGVPGTEPIAIGTPAREGPLPYLGGSPSLTAGFQDWALCELGDRIESRPGLLSATKWGPAALGGMSGGCGPCGGGSFSGNPESAALGLQLSPPHDIPAGDVGELPPAPTDHPFVMAGTGEVVYTEVDFVIPGVGFDLVWYRTYRSAYEFEGWTGYGWCHCAELYLIQEANGDVKAFFGTGRVNDLYDWDSGSSSYISPDGYWDQLTESTRGSGYTPSKYAN